MFGSYMCEFKLFFLFLELLTKINPKLSRLVREIGQARFTVGPFCLVWFYFLMWIYLCGKEHSNFRTPNFLRDCLLIENLLIFYEDQSKTRMHSSRMRTARSSSRHGGGSGPDPPQFPPWVWAWIWSPSISPLGVDLDLIPLNFPLGCGPGSDPPQFPPWLWAWTRSPQFPPLGVGLEGGGGSPCPGGDSFPGDTPPPVDRMADTCSNITFANYVCGR